MNNHPTVTRDLVQARIDDHLRSPRRRRHLEDTDHGMTWRLRLPSSASRRLRAA